jgi:hypothetical protein
MSTDEEIRTIEGYLAIDWESESAWFRITEPSTDERGRTEVFVPVSIDVRVPEVRVPTIRGEITIPAADVEATLADVEDVDVAGGEDR